MKKVDRKIIQCILNYIGSDDKLEEDIAGVLERELDGTVDFTEWLATFKIE